jgi:hypothetical protein
MPAWIPRTRRFLITIEAARSDASVTRAIAPTDSRKGARRSGAAVWVPGPGEQAGPARAVQALTKAPTILLTHPRMGEQLFEFAPRDVRRILVAHYEMRYELQDSTIYVLRLWHTREDR